MPIDIQNFGGEAPSVANHSLPDHMATVAMNCRLGSADIRPCSRLRPDHSTAETAQSIYRHDGVWIEKPEAGWRFVPGPTSTSPQRLYLTAPNGGAHIWINGTDTRLGVVPPVAAPGVSASGGSGTAETRVYVWTCVSEHGEESAPSPASATVNALPGGTVALTGMATPAHVGYAAITKKRIYRSATGASGAAMYLFAAEIAADATTYSDTIPTSNLSEELPSLGWAMPPAGLKGLTVMPGGFLAGFVGREIRLSEPWQPHAWPDAYSHIIQHDIVQLASAGRTLFILTTGPVYYMTINDIAASVPDIMPGDVPCVSPTAVVSTPSGVVYASKDGLYIAVVGATSPVLMTRAFYSELDWQTMNPQTMFGAWHADQLFLFYTNAYGQRGGMIFDQITSDPDDGRAMLRFTDVVVDAATVVPDGRLLFVASDGSVSEWEGDSSMRMTATWASKEFVSGAPINFSAALVDAEYDFSADPSALQNELHRQFEVLLAMNGGRIGGAMGMSMVGMIPFASDMLGLVAPFFIPGQYVAYQVEFKIFGDGILRYTKTINNERPFVLPTGYLARKWIVQVSGSVAIKRIAVGQSMEEIYS